MESTGKKLIVKDDVTISIGGKEYVYFMTNNYVVLGEKLKEYDCRNVTNKDLKENPVLSSDVKNAMKELGACYSLTVSNEANILNYLNGEKSFSAHLHTLKLSQKPKQRAKNLTEEYRQSVWKEICASFCSIYDNPKNDMNIIKNWDLALFCSNLVRGKPAEYCLYLMMNLFESNILKMTKKFSDVLDMFITRYLNQGNKLSEIYKNAGMSKQTFSRIRSGRIEHPTLDSILQLAVGMRLSWLDLLVLTDAAGYMNELREKRGEIVFSALIDENYNIDNINEKLWAECGTTLGFKVL